MVRGSLLNVKARFGAGTCGQHAQAALLLRVDLAPPTHERMATIHADALSFHPGREAGDVQTKLATLQSTTAPPTFTNLPARTPHAREHYIYSLSPREDRRTPMTMRLSLIGSSLTQTHSGPSVCCARLPRITQTNKPATFQTHSLIFEQSRTLPPSPGWEQDDRRDPPPDGIA